MNEYIRFCRCLFTTAHVYIPSVPGYIVVAKHSLQLLSIRRMCILHLEYVGYICMQNRIRSRALPRNPGEGVVHGARIVYNGKRSEAVPTERTLHA